MSIISSRTTTQSSSVKSMIKCVMLATFCMLLVACGGKTPEEHIEAARQFAEEGNQQAAIVELKNAIQQSPNNANARFELGQLYITVRDFASAEKELSRALELGYPENQVIPLLTEAYERTGADVALSEIQVDEANLTTAERLEVGFRQALSFIRLEKTDEAKALISELQPLESSSVYMELVKALGFFLFDDYDRSLELAVAAKQRAPLNRDVLNFLARLYMINGMETEAIKVYEEFVKVAPDELETQLILANMLVQQGEMETAEPYIDDLLKINDQNALLNQLKAVVRSSQNDFSTALRHSEISIQNGQTDPSIRLIAGFAAYQLGEFEKAVGHLSFVAEFLPNDHPGLRILAASQLQSGMGDQTSEVLSRIDNASPADAQLFSRAGLELIRASDTNAAKEIIEQAEKISETADDLTRLGILKLTLNDLEGILDLEAALEKAPESAQTITTLATAYIASGQLDKALSLSKDLQEQAPNSAEGYLIQVQIEADQGKFAEAENTLAKTLSIAPENESVLTAQVRLNLLQEKLDEALSATELLLSKYPDNIIGLSSNFAITREKGDSEEAEQQIFSRLEADPENIGLRLLASRVEFSKQEYAKAAELLKTIERNKTAPPQYWSLMGASLTRANDLKAAEEHYEAWYTVFPNQELAAIGSIVVFELQRNFDKALEVAEDFLGREDNLQISFIRAYLLTMTNDLNGAKEAYDEVDEQYRALPFLRGVNARIAILDNRAQDSVEDAKAAYESVKSFDNLILMLRAYSLTDQDQLITPLLKEHIAVVGEDPRVQMLLAERKIETDSEAAIELYEQMIADNPNNFVVLNNLAYMLMEEGNLERAESLALRAIELQTDNIAIVDTYAQILIKKGDVEAAVEEYRKAVTDDVTNEEILLNYIESLLLNGESTIAKRQIERRTFSLQASIERLEQLKVSHSL